jgi:CBS domain-containing protein
MVDPKEAYMKKISEVMTRDVRTVEPDTSVREVARLMKDLDVGAIPICDGERLTGMVTDRDIVVRALAERRDMETTRVRDVMSPEVSYCFEDQDIAEASRIMEERQIRRLPILSRERRLIGIVSLGDVAVKADDTSVPQRTLRSVSEPAKPAA